MTRASFHDKLSASWMPEFAPRAPKGETWCAASPIKKNLAVSKALHPSALKGVNRHPFKFEGMLIAQHGLDPRYDPFRFFLLLGVGVPAELKVNTPQLVGLPV